MVHDIMLPTLNDCTALRGRCCGYCKLHKCYVTFKQNKGRQCSYKRCKHFFKIIKGEIY